MPLIVLDVSAIGGKIHTEYSGVVEQNTEGLVVVDSHDAPTLLAAGAQYTQMTVDEQREKIQQISEETLKQQNERNKQEQERQRISALGSEDPDLMPDPDEDGISPDEKALRQKARDTVIQRNEDRERELEEQKTKDEQNEADAQNTRDRDESRKKETDSTTGSTAPSSGRSAPASTPSAPTPTPSNQRTR